MVLEKHPLSGRKEWVYYQPSLTFATNYARRSLKNGELQLQNLASRFSCREGLLYRIRRALRAHLMEEQRGSSPWSKRFVPVSQIDFSYKDLLQPGSTLFAVQIPPAVSPQQHQEYADTLYRVANLVVGVPLLLLNPKRTAGNWSTLPPRFRAVIEGRARWFGVDNSLLRHPALLSLGTGLFRQAALLVECGLADEVLASVPQGTVEQVLEQTNWKEAFELLGRIRPWIQVPPGVEGTWGNYPIPCTPSREGTTTYWQRFLRLHRALQRHDFDQVLEDFSKGWNLDGKGEDYRGTFSFWGRHRSTTAAHKRVLLLGRAPQKKRIAKGV